MEKSSLYAKIDEDVKSRAILYVTNSKVLKKETDTLSKLIEEALQEYMVNNPI